MANKESKIIPQRWYTLQEIVEQKMFPWLPLSYWSVRRVVLADYAQKNKLRTIAKGNGRNIRYQVKGENILTFIKAVETGSVRL